MRKEEECERSKDEKGVRSDERVGRIREERI